MKAGKWELDSEIAQIWWEEKIKKERERWDKWNNKEVQKKKINKRNPEKKVEDCFKSKRE